MALVLKDRVKVLATTTGTGTFTLGSAVTGYQDFSVIGNGNTTYYTIAAQTTPDWEVGIGTYTAAGTLLSRDTILESSNGGAAVNFPAGSKDVFVTYPAERATYLDTAGAYPVQNTFNTLNAASAVLTAGTVSTTPTAATDIANKTYVDTIAAAGIHYHAPVRLESPDTVGNLNATYNQPGGAGVGVGATLTNAGAQAALVIDGVATVVNDRILIYNQTNAAHNGVYTVTNIGSVSTNWVMTRATDADTYAPSSPNSLGQGDAFFVSAGNTGAGETYVCNTVGVITFGTTAITFAQFSSAQVYSAGTGLTLTNTTFSLSNTGTAGTYGSASDVPVFVTNAQGQVTSATNTAIAIAAGAVSGLAASATTDTTNASNITTGTLPTGRLTGSYTGVTGVGTLTAGTWNGSTVAAAYGGTGLSTFVTGDLIYADSSSTLARLADTAVGNALISGGAVADPSWGKIGLATHVDGTLPIANGGTNGAATPTAGGVAYGNGTAYAFSSAGTSGQVLTSSGTGAPSWATPTTGTVTSVTGTLPISVATGTTTPVISISQAGTSSNGFLSSTDWNTFNNKTSNTGTVTSVGGTGTVNGITLTGTVTTTGNLTLGGTLSGVSLTTQVSGTLPLANGGTNATTAADARTNLDVPTRTGGNASGTWGISVSGTATTATTANALNTANSYTGVTFTGSGGRSLFTAVSEPFAVGSRYSSSGGYVYFGASDATATPGIQLSFATGAAGLSISTAGVVSGTSFSGAGTGLTGTASSLSIGGNAATATTATNQSGGTVNATTGTFSNQLVINYNIAAPANYYNALQQEIRATSGTAGIGLHRAGFSHCGIYHDASDTLKFNMNSGTVTLNASIGTVIGSGNYNSYAPTLTGGGASGTWGIAISGNATTATSLTSSNFISQTSSTGSWNSDFQNTPAGTAKYGGDVGANGVNGPGGSWWIQQNFRHTNASNYWGTQVAWGWEDNQNRLATRNVGAGSYGAWVYYLNSANYGSFALPLSGGTMTGSIGMNDSRLYLRTNGDTNHYLWNAGDDWEELVAYFGTGFRVQASNGQTLKTYATGGNQSYVQEIQRYAAPSGTFPVIIGNSSGLPVDRGIILQASSGSSIPLYFTVSSGATVSGSVIASGGSTAYNTSSDYRMKENIRDLDVLAAVNKIMSIRPRVFDWKEECGGKKNSVGFIAHELQEYAPECVDGEKDRVHSDGAIFPQGVDSSWLIPSISAMLQEHQKVIEHLKAEVAALKGI